ncbi:hypothetical protein D3C80_1556370 [compost metagenome]
MRPHVTHGVEQGAHLGGLRLFVHQHQRLRQICQTAERETGVGEGTQIGHGDKVTIAGEIDGGIAVDHRMVRHQRIGFATPFGTAGQQRGVIEVKAQLVGRPQLQRRDVDRPVGIKQSLSQWQAQQLCALLMLRHQSIGLHKLIVQADAQAGTILNTRRGVAVFQLHIDAGAVDQEQIRRQIHRQ